MDLTPFFLNINQITLFINILFEHSIECQFANYSFSVTLLALSLTRVCIRSSIKTHTLGHLCQDMQNLTHCKRRCIDVLLCIITCIINKRHYHFRYCYKLFINYFINLVDYRNLNLFEHVTGSQWPIQSLIKKSKPT